MIDSHELEIDFEHNPGEIRHVVKYLLVCAISLLVVEFV